MSTNVRSHGIWWAATFSCVLTWGNNMVILWFPVLPWGNNTEHVGLHGNWFCFTYGHVWHVYGKQTIIFIYCNDLVKTMSKWHIQ